MCIKRFRLIDNLKTRYKCHEMRLRGGLHRFFCHKGLNAVRLLEDASDALHNGMNRAKKYWNCRKREREI